MSSTQDKKAESAAVSPASAALEKAKQLAASNGEGEGDGQEEEEDVDVDALEEGMVVIDEELVRTCLWKMEEEIEGDELERVAEFKRLTAAGERRELDFGTIEELRMSYESIFAIDNLEGLANLRVLSLDNNCIRRMVNLEPLVNLQWLDLSFNRIEKIEGLDRLTKLTDLSLCNNNISKIDNLRDCKLLKILSLGNNKISQLDQVRVLRELPKLQVLNLAGNPMCKDSEYRNFCLAYLKHLRYFDYALLVESEVTAAKEQFQDFLTEVEEKEMLEDKAHEFAEQQSRTLKDVIDAHLLPVESLVQNIFKDDPEIGKLKLLPFFDELLADYEDKYATALESFKAAALEIHFAMVKEHKKVRYVAKFRCAWAKLVPVELSFSIYVAHCYCP
eukprot:INCI3171.4.p1 GENE.INCI3171.4~~INCI3171.4.p1  ORF type:complete len:390 (-),score=94.88 INCI3171.4:854-2023(-)